MTNILKLLIDIKDLDCYKKYIRLKKLFKEDQKINQEIIELHELEKEMVNARELGLNKAFSIFKGRYEKLSINLNDNVLFCLYLEAYQNLYETINFLLKTIENEINMENFI